MTKKTEEMNIIQKLSKIQTELSVSKSRSAKYYNFRNAEDILTSLKPLLKKYNCALRMEDDIVVKEIGNDSRFYIKAHVELMDADKPGDVLDAEGWAREEKSNANMSKAQVSGAASSFARKYALNALFGISDIDDYDDIKQKNEKKKSYSKKSSKKKSKDKWINEKEMKGIKKKVEAGKYDSYYDVLTKIEKSGYKISNERKSKIKKMFK